MSRKVAHMESLSVVMKAGAKATSLLWDPFYVAAAKRRYAWRGPVPPLVNRARVGSPWLGEFLAAGRSSRNAVMAAIGDHLKQIDPPRTLDFGAGVGRTLQFMVTEPVHLSATDVDQSAIAYLRRAYPTVDVSSNRYMPPLTHFPAGSLDVVYSISIWTHLPPDMQEPWLREIRRTLRPNGLALLSTSGFAALARRRVRDSEWAATTDDDLRQQGIIYREYPWFTSGDKGTPGVTGDSYGLTAHDPAYIRAQWPASGFEVADVREGVVDGVQDLVVLRAA